MCRVKQEILGGYGRCSEELTKKYGGFDLMDLLEGPYFSYTINDYMLEIMKQNLPEHGKL